jgi:hypothetical protein
MPAGSSRALRLDPFALPARFSASDPAADTRLRHIELTRERVVVRRSLAGMRMALNMPVKAFAGVAIRLLPADEGAAVAVVLAHKDPALTLPLYIATDADEAMAEWRVWGNVLGLPLLVTEDDGGLREPFARLGQVRVARVRARRRRRSPLNRRRPKMPMRRARGEIGEATPVYRGEREIIARN